jgi:high-affinity Fe2+/Pb2+ permease
MKKLAKWKFWSFLVFGLAFIFFGAFLFATGRGSSSLAEFSLLAGTGQLVIFTVLLFYLYKGKLKEARKD